MKLRNLFVFPILASLMLVGGCKKTAPVEPTPVDPTPVEPEAILQGISVSGEFKTKYHISEEFDATGIIITATYSDETTIDVTAETEFTGFDSSVLGETIVTATYSEQTAEISLNIVAHSVSETVTDITASFGVSFEKQSNGTYFAGFYKASSTADAETFPDNAASNVLLSIANWAISNCPAYLTASSYWFYDGVISAEMSDEEKAEHDFWGDEDGSTALEAYLANEDASVLVTTITYCYNGYPCFGIQVASTAE